MCGGVGPRQESSVPGPSPVYIDKGEGYKKHKNGKTSAVAASLCTDKLHKS